jgi:hypothetical protein
MAGKVQSISNKRSKVFTNLTKVPGSLRSVPNYSFFVLSAVFILLTK